MARLTGSTPGSRSESNKSAAGLTGQGRRMKVREVIRVIPEAPRTTPGQDEFFRKENGSPLALLCTNTRVNWE